MLPSSLQKATRREDLDLSGGKPRPKASWKTSFCRGEEGLSGRPSHAVGFGLVFRLSFSRMKTSFARFLGEAPTRQVSATLPALVCLLPGGKEAAFVAKKFARTRTGAFSKQTNTCSRLGARSLGCSRATLGRRVLDGTPVETSCQQQRPLGPVNSGGSAPRARGRSRRSRWRLAVRASTSTPRLACHRSLEREFQREVEVVLVDRRQRRLLHRSRHPPAAEEERRPRDRRGRSQERFRPGGPQPGHDPRLPAGGGRT